MFIGVRNEAHKKTKFYCSTPKDTLNPYILIVVNIINGLTTKKTFMSVLFPTYYDFFIILMF